MTTHSLFPSRSGSTWRDYLPFLKWLPGYTRHDLLGDLMAGAVVAVMLVPQSMAYALLAGLPPQTGLYASLLPLVIYGLLGSSRTLAVGPVAIVSLMTAAGASALAEPGSQAYSQIALTLALLVGVVQSLMGLLRLGFLVNFLSRPVLSGFTNAAAIVIGFSQVKHLLGYSVPRSDAFWQEVWGTAARLGETNLATLAIGLGGMALLWLLPAYAARRLQGWGLAPQTALALSKGAPLLAVMLASLLVWMFQLDVTAGVRIVGTTPAGLPPLTLPQLDGPTWRALLPTVLAISFVGYMESISVAQSLASQRREKINANQELIALGLANLGVSVTGGYPVTGGFSRSLVNAAAGARSGLASVCTALLIGLTLAAFTPLFYYLPQAILAAIILIAVFHLFDLATARRAWRYSRRDGLAWLATFAAVLGLGIEVGILLGAGLSLALHLWRTSTPHVAIVGRLDQSEIYRNVLRHPVQTWPSVLALRVDESLYFANTQFLEKTVLGLVADRPEVRHLVLIGAAINEIDFSALEVLEKLAGELDAAGVALHLAAIKGPVMDRLHAIGFVRHLGADRFHLTTHAAMRALGYAPT